MYNHGTYIRVLDGNILRKNERKYFFLEKKVRAELYFTIKDT